MFLLFWHWYCISLVASASSFRAGRVKLASDDYPRPLINKSWELVTHFYRCLLIIRWVDFLFRLEDVLIHPYTYIIYNIYKRISGNEGEMPWSKKRAAAPGWPFFFILKHFLRPFFLYSSSSSSSSWVSLFYNSMWRYIRPRHFVGQPHFSPLSFCRLPFSVEKEAQGRRNLFIICEASNLSSFWRREREREPEKLLFFTLFSFLCCCADDLFRFIHRPRIQKFLTSGVEN